MRNKTWFASLALTVFACSARAPKSCPEDVQNGCPATALTYDTGIGDLLNRRCTPCHAAGGIEESRLLTDYDHVSGERMSIAEQLVSCSMPPADAPQLTTEERQQILDWLTCGGQ